jgi:hypothetical protein
LNLSQTVECVAVETVRVIPGIEALQVLNNAQVLEQQQTIGNVCLDDVRDVYAEGLEETRHLHIRTDILLTRRRIHNDERLAIAESSKVPTETGITGRGFHPLRANPEVL